MKAKGDPWFVEYLLCIGGGYEEANDDDEVRLPHDICVPYNGLILIR
jgi:ATP-dependent DNA helicase PIF1